MIYDLLDNIGNYKGISRNLDTAIDFITKTDLNALPMGKTEVDGEEVFVNVMDATTKVLTEESYEIHKDYLDIQIDLKGTEVIAIGLEGLEPLGEYKPDIQFMKAARGADCVMGPGRFIVCMAEEAHAPGGCLTEPEAIKKCVFKVKK